MKQAKKIRVLVVDDSALFRGVVSKGISADPDILVVGTAVDPFDARDKIVELEPDIMICDVVMPKMDGIEFIRRLLPQYPLRVVIVSSVSERVLDAMNAGAVDFVAKPDIATGRTPAIFLSELVEKVKIAYGAQVPKPKAGAEPARNVQQSAKAATKRVIAMGASTGGTEALFNVLTCLPANLPGIVIVQHIPPVFSQMFADRMDKALPMRVKEAQTGDYVEPGTVLIAPGDKHMTVKKLGDRLRVEVAAGEKVNGHCPSVDVLFNSVAAACGGDAVGVILTGMGSDGAKGLLAMRQKGARTIGQDEASSVVYGMPKVARDIGAVEKQLPLENIAQAIIHAVTA
ncbi:two-component system, chemotaxis family, response regulator CheB [Sporobacter termitidis DSM 10068]|uniref:Protein-glutamate methylesterase/protein-glutamine glutaminase n=1 Tax=Sporobacter termitidis DSM 10068 TaxID=1123282 RepID=A0A1M5WAK8_9FIRM|nr:chemotaxis response regulator protein-glutamate methylesterase [Sporobacter termitidis]SHH84253.1 two-component system, chemotaxis family, response regulator CheB [Sporobacter termitidis DSM 10068]